MLFKIIQPSIHLQPFIKDFFLLHFVFDRNAPVAVKPFPANTDHCLVFYIRGSITAFDTATGKVNNFARIAINGSQVSNFNFNLSSEFLMLSVNFQPGAMSKFLQSPLTEFTDERIDAETVLNPAISTLYQQMLNARTNENIIQITEQYLWKKIQTIKTDFQPIDKVSRLMVQNPVGYSVEKLADYACLSISQFERRFIQQMGIAPKLYNRINRFYSAYLLKGKRPNLDWLSIAVHTGYNDYQHLVKDFKQFSGTTPNCLLAAENKAPGRALELIARNQ